MVWERVKEIGYKKKMRKKGQKSAKEPSERT